MLSDVLRLFSAPVGRQVRRILRRLDFPNVVDYLGGALSLSRCEAEQPGRRARAVRDAEAGRVSRRACWQCSTCFRVICEASVSPCVGDRHPCGLGLRKIPVQDPGEPTCRALGKLSVGHFVLELLTGTGRRRAVLSVRSDLPRFLPFGVPRMHQLLSCLLGNAGAKLLIAGGMTGYR